MNNDFKKIYITGVSGFIGSRIARYFLESDYKVIGISRRYCSKISKELGIDVIKIDLNAQNTIKLESAHAIIHCATANEILSKNISKGLSLSIVGTSNLLEAAKNAQIQNLVFFSTAQVYGTELNGYFNESTEVDCKNFYSINHYLGEELCKFYCNTQNFNISIIRPSNIYGVPEISTVDRKTLVPMCFVEEAVKFGSITIRSSGKQTRNFVSIDNVAKLTFDITKNFPKGFSIRNSGSNYCSSMLDIAKIVSNSYFKKFKKHLIINIESDKPDSHNAFEYCSSYVNFLGSAEASQIKISLVIDKLFERF